MQRPPIFADTERKSLHFLEDHKIAQYLREARYWYEEGWDHITEHSLSG